MNVLFVVIILWVEVAVSQTKEFVSLPPASVKLIVTEVPAQTLHWANHIVNPSVSGERGIIWPEAKPLRLNVVEAIEKLYKRALVRMTPTGRVEVATIS